MSPLEDRTRSVLTIVLLSLAIATFLGALVVWLFLDKEATILYAAIVLEAIAVVGLVLLLVWPQPAFAAGEVNPQLVRCPRCSSVFDPPKRGEDIVCPTCGLHGKPPPRKSKELRTLS